MFKYLFQLSVLILILFSTACTMENANKDEISNDSIGIVKNGNASSGIIKDGSTRFSVITPTLIRMEYDENGYFEDRPTQTVATRPSSTSSFEKRIDNGELIIETSAITLRYQRNSGPFSPDNLTIELLRGVDIIEARPDWSFAPQSGNLGGWRRGLDNEKDPQPLHEGILSRAGWYLLNDSNTVLLTDTAAGFEVRSSYGGTYQDGYLFGYGQDYVQGLKDLRTLTGAAPLLPKKALGVWFSKWWSYTDPEWRAEIKAFSAHNVPLDTISIDTDWKRVHQQLGCTVLNVVITAPLDDACSWNGWDWNRDIFPDPEGFVSWVHEQGIDIGLNVHPSISGSDPAYPDTVAKTAGLMNDDAELPCTILQADPSSPCYIFDWTQPEQFEAYFDLHEPIEAMGIDFWWLDWCCEGSRAQAPGLSADTWINAGYAKQHKDMGSRWPAFSRIGGSFQNGFGGVDNNGLGAFAEHRYSIHFTGDTCSTWELMAAQAAMTAAEGNIGLPYVSHDIGSFLGEPATSIECSNRTNTGKHLPDDMYVRWIQFGTFQPINRLHSHHGDRLPWEYPGKAEKVASDFLRLRGQLVPTLYTLSREAHDSGLPMVRSLYLQWPEDEEAYTYSSQFTLGQDMMIATVAAPGDPAVVDLWIPTGEWVDFFTGEEFTGPAEITRSVPLEEYAVFMRKGAILPMQPELPTSKHGPQDNLIVNVWPGADGAFQLYEDEGHGFAYQEGAYQWTPLTTNTSSNDYCHTLKIESAQGNDFPGALASRSWQLRFVSVEAPQSVSMNGKEVRMGSNTPGWTYDASTRSVTVNTGARNTRQATTVTTSTGECE
ncbi:MAG: alpha-glucosidase (family GH31 glycosyl hydrolase) [Oleispira sp.]|jgi:alpha-glucosidase (family GH31 glycosyl hydrolase)